MRRFMVTASLYLLCACGQQAAIGELARCERELGSADNRLATAQAAQAAAERKVQALEEDLRVVREELSTTRSASSVAQDSASTTSASVSPTVLPVPPERGGHRLKVGLALPQREERWVKDKLTMLAEARRRGIELVVQTSEDAARQLAQCEEMIDQGVQVLIVSPDDANAAAAIVDKAARAGVPVISYDRLVLDSPHDYYYLSFDNVKVGEMQGEWLSRRVPRGNLILLSGAPTDNNAKLLRQGAMKYLQPLIDRGDVKVVLDQPVTDWSPSEAQRLCEQALYAAKDDVQGVLAPNDGTAGGCVQALASRGLAGKVFITGQDGDLAAALRIVRGEQGMTVFKDTRNLGKTALEMAETLGRGRSYDTGGRTVSNNRRKVKAVLLSPIQVTRENLDETLIKSGYLSRSAVYRK